MSALQFLDAATLDKFAARTSNAEGRSGRNLLLAGAVALTLEAPPEGADPAEVGNVNGAVVELARFSQVNDQIQRDHRLTERGKAEALDGDRTAVLRIVAEAYASLNVAEKRLDTAEAKFYELPVDPKDLTQVALTQRISDLREIRDWLRGLDSQEALRRVGDLEAGTANVRILEAILNDPCGAMGPLAEIAGQKWREYRNKFDEAGRAGLDLDRATVEWARRALLTIGGVVLSVARIPRERVAALLHEVNHQGWAVFGLTQSEIVVASRLAKARKAKAA